MRRQKDKYHIVIIGSSTPLQKVLPHFYQNDKINIRGVFLDTNKDRSAIKFCEKHGIPYYSAKEIGSKIKELTPVDWLFSVNSTVILPGEVLEIPRKGSLNIHPGLLPQYAGLHTHQWAIRNREKEFGVTLHWMEKGIDTGDIAFQKKCKLTGKETGLSLYLKCIGEGVELVKKALEYISLDQPIPSTKQDLSLRRLYTAKMAKDGRIDWNWDYDKLEAFFRAADYGPFESPTYSPYTTLKDKKLYIKKIIPDHSTPTLPAGKFSVIRDQKILVGSRDTNLVVFPDFGKSDFKNYKELISAI